MDKEVGGETDRVYQGGHQAPQQTMISGQLCGLESTRVEGSPAPSLLPTGDAGARGEECQLGVERERVNPGGGTPRARRWQGQLSGHKRQDKRGLRTSFQGTQGPQ